MFEHGFFGALLYLTGFIGFGIAILGWRRCLYLVLTITGIAMALAYVMARLAAWALRRARRLAPFFLAAAVSACSAAKTENTAPLPAGDYRALPSADHWQPTSADLAAAAAVSGVKP